MKFISSDASLMYLNTLDKKMTHKDTTGQSNSISHTITISADGYWKDQQGNQWRLVPTMCSVDQMEVAVGRAQQWTDKHLSQMLRLEYATGYEAMLRLAPSPPLDGVDSTPE
jgi:hypothetical protein